MLVDNSKEVPQVFAETIPDTYPMSEGRDNLSHNSESAVTLFRFYRTLLI